MFKRIKVITLLISVLLVLGKVRISGEILLG